MFEVTIKESSKKLNAIDTMRVKRYSNGEKIRPGMKMEIIGFVECSVHNDEARNKDYDVMILLTPDETYYTSSPVFKNNMKEIARDLEASGITYDSIVIKVGTKPSKNFPDRECLLPQFVNVKAKGFENVD